MATVQRGKRISNDVNDNKTIVWSGQDKTLARIESAPLSDQDVNDLVDFLKSLSSDSLLARSKSGAP